MRDMTDNKIIKALECCGNIVDSTCKGCVYHETYNASCVVRLMRDALDLINRQQAEIERLEAQHREMCIGMKVLKKKAIEKFAERLCNGRVSNDPVVIAVKVELERMKEMTEVNEDE